MESETGKILSDSASQCLMLELQFTGNITHFCNASHNTDLRKKNCTHLQKHINVILFIAQILQYKLWCLSGVAFLLFAVCDTVWKLNRNLTNNYISLVSRRIYYCLCVIIVRARTHIHIISDCSYCVIRPSVEQDFRWEINSKYNGMNGCDCGLYFSISTFNYVHFTRQHYQTL